MACEILSVKLCELDQRISQLHSRIALTQNSSQERLLAEISRMQQVCSLEALTLRSSLENSQAPAARKMAQIYAESENLTQEMQTIWEEDPPAGPDPDEKLLLAEYALDFALQTADRALLAALDAMAAQPTEEEPA